MALVLNPRTGHVLPQFHVKFDDFFETVQSKDTDLDAPDPQWKYLSGFANCKGQPKVRTAGPLGDLIALRRGPTTAPQPATATEDLTTHQQPIMHHDTGDVDLDNAVALAPVPPQPPTQQAPVPAPRTVPFVRHKADGWSRIPPGTIKV